MQRRKILFFCEAVTLAHVARPLALAAALPADRFEVSIACNARYSRFLQESAATILPLQSISSEAFLAALATGSPVYDLPTLRDYVRADLALIDQARPDLIVGDFRLSLSVSARLRKIAYAGISNTYWSPFYRYQAFPMPVLPISRVLPLALARLLYEIGKPFVFPGHCKPLNTLRMENGLAPLRSDLRRVYTDADFMLFADDPVLFPTDNSPAAHHRLGPVPWSPAIPEPASWNQIDAGKPTIYLTLGSSGAASVAESAFAALSQLDINLIVAAPAATMPTSARAHVFQSDYLPGEQAARRADLVVCNGGSPTSQQALAAGVPVIGICGNLDQFMNMAAIVRQGAGTIVRGDRVNAGRLNSAVHAVLANPQYRHAAKALQRSGADLKFGEIFREFVEKTR